MIKKICVAIIIAAVKSSTVCSQHDFEYVDFNASMQTNRYVDIIQRHKNSKLLDFFRVLYDKQKSLLRTTEYVVRIPQIMHHVWFGKPLCDEYKALRDGWMQKHPCWVTILWTDRASNDPDAHVVRTFSELDDILQENSAQRIVVLTDALDFDNKKNFDHAINYGEKSDVLKWEIVYRYGGVYIDTDFECYKSLDCLHHLFNFYTCLQPLDTGHVQLGAALFAATPYHPILKQCVTTLQEGSGPIVVRTGPIHFTNAFIRVALQASGYNIVFPASYFYPCGYEEQHMPECDWKKEESFAMHHWCGSWLKPEAFVNYAGEQ